MKWRDTDELKLGRSLELLVVLIKTNASFHVGGVGPDSWTIVGLFAAGSSHDSAI
jgi:hypothetical protein